MRMDLAVDEDGNFKIDPDTGDFVMMDDTDLAESTRIALGTNRGELRWNSGFGLDHLSLESGLDDETAVESEMNDYLESQFDNFVSLTVDSIDRNGRTATIKTEVTYLDDDGNEQVANGETEVNDNAGF